MFSHFAGLLMRNICISRANNRRIFDLNDTHWSESTNERSVMLADMTVMPVMAVMAVADA